MILQAMSFNEFQDCKALLQRLEDVVYVNKYKFNLESKFDEMVDWFLRKKLEITTRPIPAYASDNRKVNLLELYMVVKREGGHMRVTENNLWAVIKSTQQKETEKEIAEDAAEVRRSRSLDNQEGTRRNNAAEQDGEHYAFYVGNDWHRLKKLQKRRKFDFKQAEKAVNEAKRSVMMHSRKNN
ncbi:putative transcription factor & chromatin remodeling ARID family [Helianthus annuus]|nr:putative transcription factor & chromatin remodeling ARID family [Helianthus annuus]